MQSTRTYPNERLPRSQVVLQTTDRGERLGQPREPRHLPCLKGWGIYTLIDLVSVVKTFRQQEMFMASPAPQKTGCWLYER